MYLAVVPASIVRAQPLALQAAADEGDVRLGVLCSFRRATRNGTSARAVRSILMSTDAHFEVVVLDDGSTDRTAQVVREIAENDDRVRLESAPPLPVGWCGKQHACHVLSRLASHPLLIFLDADVRLQPDALARISAFMEQSGAALASGVPGQETKTFSERLLIPLVAFCAARISADPANAKSSRAGVQRRLRTAFRRRPRSLSCVRGAQCDPQHAA